MQTRRLAVLAAFCLAAASFVPAASAAKSAAKPAAKSAADLEREKALANPYPSDFGPDHLDPAVLASYPKPIQEGYRAMLGNKKTKNCQACHTASRPLNSRFVEPVGKTLMDKEAAIAKLKKEHPEYFKDGAVWQIEAHAWLRYVRRMMSKPGCNIKNADGKKIWEFLVYDSWHRKLGANAAAWKAHREQLIEKLKEHDKANHTNRYQELSEDQDL